MLNKQNPSGTSSPSMTPQNMWQDRDNSLFKYENNSLFADKPNLRLERADSLQLGSNFDTPNPNQNKIDTYHFEQSPTYILNDKNSVKMPLSELGSQTNKMPDLSIISSDGDSIEMRKRRKDQLQRDFLPGNYALSMKDQLFQRYNG